MKISVRFSLSFTVFFFVLVGCSSYDGLVKKRDSNRYSFVIPKYDGTRIVDRQSVLFHAAYEICLKNHKMGFVIATQIAQESFGEEVESLVTCEGPIDPLLKKKFEGTALQMEENTGNRDFPSYKKRFRIIGVKP